MVFRGLSHRKLFIWAYHTKYGFEEFATPKVVFRGLSHGNDFKELAIPKMVFMGLPHRKLISGACHMENGFECHPTRKIVQKGFPQRKSF